MTKSRGIRAPRQPWTDKQLQILIERYSHERTEDLVTIIGRSKYSIFNQARKLGLSKSDEFHRTDLSGRIQRGRSDPRMVATQFPKGHIPANKGLLRPGFAPGRMAQTQFKKGNQPHNAHQIGSYRITKDGTLQRKISNAKGSNSKRWRGVHELVWIEANGPVPKGHICVFKSGMKTNILEEITLDKVECISLAENMRRNTYHNRYPKEIGLAIQLRGALTRRINNLTRQEETQDGE